MSDANLHVVFSEADDMERLKKEIHDVEPDVVLMEESLALMTNTSVVDLMNTFSDLYVIVVNDNDNWLQLFRKNTQLITSSAEFIQAIHTVKGVTPYD